MVALEKRTGGNALNRNIPHMNFLHKLTDFILSESSVESITAGSTCDCGPVTFMDWEQRLSWIPSHSLIWVQSQLKEMGRQSQLEANSCYFTAAFITVKWPQSSGSETQVMWRQRVRHWPGTADCPFGSVLSVTCHLMTGLLSLCSDQKPENI